MSRRCHFPFRTFKPAAPATVLLAVLIGFGADCSGGVPSEARIGGRCQIAAWNDAKVPVVIDLGGRVRKTVTPGSVVTFDRLPEGDCLVTALTGAERYERSVHLSADRGSHLVRIPPPPWPTVVPVAQPHDVTVAPPSTPWERPWESLVLLMPLMSVVFLIGEFALPRWLSRLRHLPLFTKEERVVTRTVLELDLKGYSKVIEVLDGLSVRVVLEFNRQIQRFVDIGLRDVGLSRGEVVMGTTGDGALLFFKCANDAHKFACAVHRATEAHNAGRSESAQRRFRMGAATGEIVQNELPGGGFEIAGAAIVRAVRLETAAQVGQLLIDPSTFDTLTSPLQERYGPEEEVSGKAHDKAFRARRCDLTAGEGSTTSRQGTAA